MTNVWAQSFILIKKVIVYKIDQILTLLCYILQIYNICFSVMLLMLVFLYTLIDIFFITVKHKFLQQIIIKIKSHRVSNVKSAKVLSLSFRLRIHTFCIWRSCSIFCCSSSSSGIGGVSSPLAVCFAPNR